MASSKAYLHFILEQLSDLDDISYRPMMGEFILYYRGKIVGGIYDDRLLVKKTRSALERMPAAIWELPYEGAKEILLVDEVDSKEFLTKLFEAMYDELPSRKRKNNGIGGKPMNYIRITKENIDKEHICCAMSGKQSVAKKEWLGQRFDDGLVFYRSEERGKCFIEYIPAENAWVPIEADGYLYINCLWVSGSMKGHGYSNDLLEECIRDAKTQGKKGICILCAEGRKREFLADPKFLNHKDFRVADISDCGINLMYLPMEPSAQIPKFRECAKHPAIGETGFVLYYTDQCPYTYYWVPRV